MEYKNQLVLTGEINDVGAYNRTNVDVSYRRGLELDAGFKLHKKLSVGFNANLSMNKLPEFIEYVGRYDNGGQAQIIHSNTDIAFSPNIIMGASLNYLPIKGLEISLLPKHVGKQYLDNTQNENRMLKAYSIANFRINYTLEKIIGKELSMGILVNNITNLMYENNGYTFSYIAGGATTTENFYYPQAGRNFLVNVTLKF
jgi:iron complex outermembrane receptor protein